MYYLGLNSISKLKSCFIVGSLFMRSPKSSIPISWLDMLLRVRESWGFLMVTTPWSSSTLTQYLALALSSWGRQGRTRTITLKLSPFLAPPDFEILSMSYAYQTKYTEIYMLVCCCILIFLGHEAMVSKATLNICSNIDDAKCFIEVIWLKNYFF